MKWLVLALALALVACARRVEPDGHGRAPVPVAMDPTRALGEWKSGHGAVAIGVGERGDTLVGTWRYQRDGFHEGRFQGYLDGNLLRFAWVEGELTGEGWIAFAPDGSNFVGEWWSAPRKRTEWRGNVWFARGTRPGARFVGTR